MMAETILALNAGSSSIKFALFDVEEAQALKLAYRGEVDGIGEAAKFAVRDAEGSQIEERSFADSEQGFPALLEMVVEWAERQRGAEALIGVGHRVVHGGADHVRPERLTAEVLAELEDLTPLAPLHQPHNLALIRAIAAARPRLAQVACYDTAFHRTMPRVATRFALPREYDAAGVRRYGFHGVSYEYIARRLAETAPELAAGRVIVAHLGNGASLCAMRAGRSVDTTMGLTALDGLVMGTRPGNLDPGAILYLEQVQGMTAKEVEDLLYRRSGLLGVSGGIASDMRALLGSVDPRAGGAIELFVFRIAREAGALASSLGGLDGMVFTAGIGEHAPAIRAMVGARLGWLGVAIDGRANAQDAAVISRAGSRVAVRVIPTDEELMIARHTLETIRTGS